MCVEVVALQLEQHQASAVVHASAVDILAVLAEIAPSDVGAILLDWNSAPEVAGRVAVGNIPCGM